MSKKKLTRDQEAELIIERLKKTDKERRDEFKEKIGDEIAKAIQEEVDNEIILSLVKLYLKKENE